MLIYDASTWEAWHFVAWAAFVLVGIEVLNFIVLHMDAFFHGQIPAGGKPLDKLTLKDQLFIAFNKFTTMFFSYHVIRFAWYSGNVKWGSENITLANTIGSFIAFHIVYDLFYTWFHRILHIRALYPYVHKHHHRQHVPSRGNTDAVNVHPFEFLTGEYLHLFCIWLIPSHIFTVAVFILLGGFLASLNHTRVDVTMNSIYQVKFHDLHHRIPTVNYGQYIMLWDWIFGSFQPYSKVDAEKAAQ